MTQYEDMKAKLELASDASDEEVAAAVAAILKSQADKAAGADDAVAALEARVDAKFEAFNATLQGLVEAVSASSGTKGVVIEGELSEANDGSDKTIADASLVLQLKSEIAALKKHQAEKEAEEKVAAVEALISAAINDGRVLDAERKMLTKMGLADENGIRDLKAYLDECRSMAMPALVGAQTDGHAVLGGDDVLSPHERMIASQLTPEVQAEMRRLKARNNRAMLGV